MKKETPVKTVSLTHDELVIGRTVYHRYFNLGDGRVGAAEYAGITHNAKYGKVEFKSRSKCRYWVYWSKMGKGKWYRASELRKTPKEGEI